MSKLPFLILAFICSSFLLFSQSNQIDSVVNKLESDQLVYEKIFVHTNKTVYQEEDTIWFKIYVTDHDNKPSRSTVLAYVSLFSENGNLIDTRNVYIKDGVGNNQFTQPEGILGGNYYIQAHTNNMLNFGKDHKFVTKIKIGDDILNETSSIPLYDIQFFPEGGHLLENVKNVVGIKVLINGMGSDYKGQIINSKGLEVSSFSNEHLGMSKTHFTFQKNEKYKAIINLNDTIIQKDLPIALETGISVSKITEDNQIIKFEIRTNSKIRDDSYVMLFHQNNKIIDYIDIDLNDQRKKIYTFYKKDFLPGVNSLTVLKNNDPYLERKFFIAGKVVNQAFLKSEERVEDSLIYKLSFKAIKSKSNVSISVLSSNSNYTSNTDIVSAMLLTPYVKGYIENPSFYFDKSNKNIDNAIDLLLITQGWSQHKLDVFIENLNPKEIYNFEKGYTLKGSFSPLLTNSLGLFTTNGQLITNQVLNNQTTFSFQDLIAFKGDTIKLSFIDRGVLRRKPKKLKFDSIVSKEDNFNFIFTKKYSKTLLKESNEIKSLNLSIKNDVEEREKENGINQLETVYLKKTLKNQEFLEAKAFDKKHNKEIFDIGAYYKLDIPSKFKEDGYLSQDYLFKERGYRLYDYYGYPHIIKDLIFRDGKEVPLWIKIMVDGKRLSFYKSLSLEMKYVEAIRFKPGTRFPYRPDTIAFFTTEEYKNGTSINFENYVFKEGYDNSTNYYTPLYLNSNQILSDEIDWKPNLISNASGEFVFKLKDNLDHKNLFFYIQGLSNQGELISVVYKTEKTSFK
jgi:hypothetical protein